MRPLGRMQQTALNCGLTRAPLALAGLLSLGFAAFEEPVELTYDPDLNHREKHRGTSAVARVTEDEDGALVGKCSSEIDTELAQRLLDEGVRWSPATDRSPIPKYVFNTYKGVPYRAHRRGNTRNYHGFPDVKNRIPRAVRDQLRALATKEGAQAEFDNWMQETEKYT